MMLMFFDLLFRLFFDFFWMCVFFPDMFSIFFDVFKHLSIFFTFNLTFLDFDFFIYMLF